MRNGFTFFFLLKLVLIHRWRWTEFILSPKRPCSQLGKWDVVQTLHVLRRSRLLASPNLLSLQQSWVGWIILKIQLISFCTFISWKNRWSQHVLPSISVGILGKRSKHSRCMEYRKAGPFLSPKNIKVQGVNMKHYPLVTKVFWHAMPLYTILCFSGN